jgi:hypothetical protein
VDPYNTQSAIALLRQHMEYAHVYDMSKLQLKQILNTQVSQPSVKQVSRTLPNSCAVSLRMTSHNLCV